MKNSPERPNFLGKGLQSHPCDAILSPATILKNAISTLSTRHRYHLEKAERALASEKLYSFYLHTYAANEVFHIFSTLTASAAIPPVGTDFPQTKTKQQTYH